jgi:hypothetical protein
MFRTFTTAAACALAMMVMIGFVRQVTAQHPSNPRAGEKLVVANDNTKLMIGTRALGTLNRGDEIAVIQVKDRWIGASIESDGKQVAGWVWYENLATPENFPSTQARQAVVPRRQVEQRRFSYIPQTEQVPQVAEPQYYGGFSGSGFSRSGAMNSIGTQSGGQGRGGFTWGSMDSAGSRTGASNWRGSNVGQSMNSAGTR